MNGNKIQFLSPIVDRKIYLRRQLKPDKPDNEMNYLLTKFERPLAVSLEPFTGDDRLRAKSTRLLAHNGSENWVNFDESVQSDNGSLYTTILLFGRLNHFKSLFSLEPGNRKTAYISSGNVFGYKSNIVVNSVVHTNTFHFNSNGFTSNNNFNTGERSVPQSPQDLRLNSEHFQIGYRNSDTPLTLNLQFVRTPFKSKTTRKNFSIELNPELFPRNRIFSWLDFYVYFFSIKICKSGYHFGL